MWCRWARTHRIDVESFVVRIGWGVIYNASLIVLSFVLVRNFVFLCGRLLWFHPLCTLSLHKHIVDYLLQCNAASVSRFSIQRCILIVLDFAIFTIAFVCWCCLFLFSLCSLFFITAFSFPLFNSSWRAYLFIAMRVPVCYLPTFCNY